MGSSFDSMLKTIVSTLHQRVMGSSQSLQSAAEMVSYWLSRPNETIFGPRADKYLEALFRLQQSPNSKEVNANALITGALDRLKTEFNAVLRRQADYQAGPASTTEWSSIADSTANVFRYEDYTLPDPPNVDEIKFLRNIATRMDHSGKIRECVRVYVSARTPFLQDQLKKIKFKELSIGGNVNRHSWDELKVKIELWIQLSKICVKKLFLREKQICDQIFRGTGNNTAKDDCFVETVSEFAVGLISFVEEVSKSSQSYDRMEKVLALYSAFLSVLPEVNALFPSAPGDDIRNTCAETLSRIETEVGRMLHDLEHDVLHEKSKVLLDERGVVHRCTEYAMDQINVIVRNRNLLTELIKSPPSFHFGNITIAQADLGDVTNSAFIHRHLLLIIVALRKNLDTKSKEYPDSSSREFFIMNNVHFVVQRVEASPELQEMIGDAFMKKLKEDFNCSVQRYQALICSKFSECFKDDGLYTTRCFRSRPSKTAHRKKLDAFNSAYDDMKSRYSSWTIPDPRLREHICNFISGKLVPEYRNFLDKFRRNSETAIIPEKNAKYSPEDLEELVSKKLFANS